MARKSGQKIHDLETKVAPEQRLLFHWMAFARLSGDRAQGMGLGPIPWTAIDRYAERYDVIADADEYDRFVGLIRAIDRAFLDWHSER